MYFNHEYIAEASGEKLADLNSCVICNYLTNKTTLCSSTGMHKKSMEITKKSPGSPESTHSDSYSEDAKAKDSDMSWSNRASAADDMEDMAIDLSSSSKQDSKSTLKSSPRIHDTSSESYGRSQSNSDSENDS